MPTRLSRGRETQVNPIADPWQFLTYRQHCGDMSDLIDVRSRPAASTTTPHRKASVLRFALAGVFVVLLLGAAQLTEQWSSQALPATLGFTSAITIIVAAFVGWERQVADAESAGLVKHTHEHADDKGVDIR